jgi:hypothetical protein
MNKKEIAKQLQSGIGKMKMKIHELRLIHPPILMIINISFVSMKITRQNLSLLVRLELSFGIGTQMKEELSIILPQHLTEQKEF